MSIPLLTPEDIPDVMELLDELSWDGTAFNLVTPVDAITITRYGLTITITKEGI